MWPDEELRDACSSGDVARVTALIRQHRGVAARHFDSLLSLAARNGHVDVFDALIDGEMIHVLAPPRFVSRPRLASRPSWRNCSREQI